MEVTWDARKAEQNFKKHGIAFEEAATVLKDPMAAIYQEDSSGEDRQIWVGHSAVHRLLLVVICERLDQNEIRIISARKPTIKERQKYEERI